MELILVLVAITTMILLFIYSIPHSSSNSESFLPQISTIPIYIIHQSSKSERKNRFEKLVKDYFKNNIVYIIEPVSNTDIERNLLSYFKKNMITFDAFEAIRRGEDAKRGSLTNASLSLALTNIEIYKLESQRKNPFFLVLEDDFTIVPPPSVFFKETQKIFSKLQILSQKEWDVLYLSCHSEPYLRKEAIESAAPPEILKIKHNLHGMGAVLYTNKAITRILKNIFPLSKQIDHDIPEKMLLAKKKKNKLNGYIIFQTNGKKFFYNDNFFYRSTTQAGF